MQYTSMYLNKPNYQPENNDIGAEIRPAVTRRARESQTTEDDNQNDPCVAALV